MRFLLRPGWIAATIVVAAFAFACYYLLAPWQFHRSDERDGTNTAVAAALTHPPVPRAQLVAPGTEPAASTAWRQVIVSGTYEPAGEVLVRLRTVDGNAAYEIMTPLRAADGETLLVDRGYVRPQTGQAIPPIAPAPAGPVTVVGYQRPDEGVTDRPAVVSGGYRQVYAADTRLVTAATGVGLSPGYVQLVAGQPGVLTPVPLPPPDPNSSYSYAWQWLIFGLMAIGGWVYFVRMEYRTGRGLGAPVEEIERSERPEPDAAPRERTTSDVLADRYGRR